MLSAGVAQAKVAELITVFGEDYAEATTNGYDSLQAAIDAFPDYSTNSASCVRLLADRHETIRISAKTFVRISLGGHVLYPDSTAKDGEVFSFDNANGSGVVEICDGRLAGNCYVSGSNVADAPSFVLFYDVILGDAVSSVNGQIKSTGSCWFEFGTGFIGNCTEAYDIAEQSGFVVEGAIFACDQSHVNCNEDVKIEPNGESGGFIAEEIEEAKDADTWNSTSSWMSGMMRQTPLSRLVMISSHDAGMVDGHTFGLGYGPSNCQKKRAENQMKEAGSRYFDLRPRMLGVRPLHTWYTCHFATIGQKISTFFKDAKSFLTENPGETVFMRISHYDNTDKFKDLISMLLKDYDSYLFKRKDRPILNEIPLGEVRGKIIMVIEKGILKNPKFEVSLDPSRGIWGCDEQEGYGCVPGKEGGYLYIHDEYANNDDYDKMKEVVFKRWEKQSEHINAGILIPERRAFMLCWQLTMQPPFVGRGWRHYTNHYRAYVCSQHLKADMEEGIIGKNYVKPMFVNLDYVDDGDFKIVNAYNECYRASGGRVCIPQDMWDDMQNHPSVGFSIRFVEGSKTNDVKVANGYRESPYHCFDLPFVGKDHDVIVQFSVPPGSKDIKTGEPVASKTLEFVDGGTNVIWNVERFPAMTTVYVDHDDVGGEIVREINETDLTPIHSGMSELCGGIKYVVAGNITFSGRMRVNGDGWLLIPDGKSMTLDLGIDVSGTNTLSIYGQRKGTGILSAQGGPYESGIGNFYQAAIGGDANRAAGTIKIHGGTITAQGGVRACGIGSSSVVGNDPAGTVIIYGGTVTATGGEQGGAGIGGGSPRVGEDGDAYVAIYGGNVTACGGENSAGIGGSPKHHAGIIRIYGGSVAATGGMYGAGIGAGGSASYNHTGTEGFCGEITINGGNVTAIGGQCAAGIGGGGDQVSCCGVVTVSGGTVIATGGMHGTGIGVGYANSLYDGSIVINGGTVTATGVGAACGIGGMATKLTFGPGFVGAVLAGEDAENADYVLVSDFADNPDAKYAKMPVATLRIPQVAGVDCSVSNPSGVVASVLVNGTNTYAVTPGDWMSVSFEPCPGGVFIKEPTMNPMYLGIADGITVVDRADLPTAGFPYCDYDGPESGMINAVRPVSECEIVTKDTASFSTGWYVINDQIENASGGIVVSGDARLILCDGASLMVNGSGKPGIEVTVSGSVTNSLSIYGQASGTGLLKVLGGTDCAGIGGNNGEKDDCGIVTVNGGTVDATGGGHSAGLGGGGEAGHGGAVTINGGTVTALGAGGRTVDGGWSAAAAIGAPAKEISSAAAAGTVTFGKAFEGGVIAGVDASLASFKTPAQYSVAHGAKYVTMPVRNPVEIKIPQVDGIVYVVSNAMKSVEANSVDGTNVYVVCAADRPELHFRICPGYAYEREPVANPKIFECVMSSLTVDLAELPTTERVPIEYLEWDDANGVLTNAVRQISEVEFVTPETDELADGWYVVNRDIVNATDGIVVTGNARFILCDDVSLTSIGTLKAGVGIIDGCSLTIYGQMAGSGRLVAVGDDEFAGIGGASIEASAEVTVNGGIVTARGGSRGSGIGGGMYGVGGTVIVNAGEVAVFGGESGKGIGAGYLGDGGAITINGGRVTAESDDRGADLGGNSVAISGGAVKASSIWGEIAISGGIFSHEPLPEWLVPGYKVVANEDESTKADYPCAIADDRPRIIPGEPVVCDTAKEATNAAKNAVLTLRDDVSAALGSDAERQKYRNMFEFGVVPAADGKWAVEAFLKEPDWTNVVESAQAATRQIPVADLAALGLGDPTNVSVEGCVPGFYYSLYSGTALTNVKAFASEKSYNVLCKPETPVTFEEIVKPSDASGYFMIGVLEVPIVYVPGEQLVVSGKVPVIPGHQPIAH